MLTRSIETKTILHNKPFTDKEIGKVSNPLKYQQSSLLLQKPGSSDWLTKLSEALYDFTIKAFY
ncbi:MAG: hypothetical protein AB1782_04225 [Cyanobacteriota bacterium]